MALLAGLCFAACTIERADVRTPSGEPPEADSTRVREAFDAVVRAIVAGDPATLDSLFHDSVTVFVGARSYAGRTSLSETPLPALLASTAERRLLTEGVRVRLTANFAWVTCGFRLEALQAGTPLSAGGVATIVFHRVAGRWYVLHAHLSGAEVGLPGLEQRR